MFMSPTFCQAGILIRPFAPDDRTSLYAAVRESIESVGQWMAWCHAGYSIDDTDVWISLCQTKWRSGADREFGIFDAETGAVLGCVGVNQISSADNLANLGYWVRASRVGRGVASTAARMAARFAFQELKLSRLEVVAREDNLASRRVAEKIGCQFECIARNRLFFKAQAHHAAMYSLLPNDIAG